MKVGSLVEVVKSDGGIRKGYDGSIGQKCNPINVGEIYVVRGIDEKTFPGHIGIYLEEKVGDIDPIVKKEFGYLSTIFRELQAPLEISIESLIEQPAEHV